MPIKGLTTQAPQFPIMGKLRKGAEKPVNSKRPGLDLDHFRYTSETHPESVEAFSGLFDSPQSLTVLLPYSTVDENFEAWMEVWGSARLKHRCDGEMVHMIYDEQKRTYVYPKSMPCPGGCKQVGRLKVIIPSMLQAGHVGVVMLETHSKWDISGIYGALAHYYDMRKNLQGIEFILHRYPREVSTPKNGRQTKWLVGIKPNHEWVIAQLGAQMEYQALPAGPQVVNVLPEKIPHSPHDLNLDEMGNEVVSEIEVATFTEESEPTKEAVITAKQVAYLNTLGRNAYGDEWDEKRKLLVGKVSDDRVSSSKDLTQPMFNKLKKGIQGKIEEVSWELVNISEVMFQDGDFIPYLEEKGMHPLADQSIKSIEALILELKGSGDGIEQPELIGSNGNGNNYED